MDYLPIIKESYEMCGLRESEFWAGQDKVSSYFTLDAS